MYLAPKFKLKKGAILFLITGKLHPVILFSLSVMTLMVVSQIVWVGSL